MRHPSASLIVAPLLIGACLTSTEPSDIPEADLRVLFVGNSLTYTNDMPGMVQHLASSSGLSFAYGVAAQPNYSLEDHWASGIAGVIQQQQADVVVMQQGPSSVPSHQAHLAHWAGQLAHVIRAAGGEPALLMVWPDNGRLSAFDDVHTAYRNAATAVDGLFLPAGEAWRAAWVRDAGIATYGTDGFHPSAIGSMAAALTVFAVLFEAESLLESCQFPAYLAVSTAVMQVLCAAVRDALETPPPDDGKPRSSPGMVR